MAQIELNNVIEGAGGTILRMAGAPSAGTDEIQTITTSGTISSGTFTLTFEGHTTAAITWSSTNATLVSNIDAALEALPNIGTGGVTTAVGTATSGVGTFTVTFTGNRAKQAVGLMVATSSLAGSGANVVVTETTPGVTASFRGAPKGALLVNETAGTLFTNTGTAGLAPTWTAQV